MRILLVEDNADHRELIRRALSAHDATWQVDDVVSGEEALRHLAEGEVYDLVFLDYGLPRRDGLEVLEEIRRGGAALPVVIVTGRGDEHVAVRALKAGAYDYVSKGEGYLMRLPVVAQRAVEAHHSAVARRLAARDGRNLGLLMLSDKYEGHFSANDEAILVQLAAMGSVALENARLYEQVESGREQMRRLSQQVISTSEEERRRLAHELHDEAGQALTALKIKLEMTAAEMSGVFAEAVPGLREAISITDATMEQIRVLAQNLRPPSLDAVGLNAAIEGLCRSFARQTQLTIDYAGAVLPPLEGALDIMLYRVLQEALTNVAKHAGAKHVQVDLCLEGDTVRLSVQDDGRGFENLAGVVEGGQCKGMGLLGMRERVVLLGGSLEIESLPGCGTRLVALVPCPHLH
jgi:signal transduction histidine kinase